MAWTIPFVLLRSTDSWVVRIQHLCDMKCIVMIWRSWVLTPIGLNFGCVVLLSKLYMNQKYQCGCVILLVSSSLWETHYRARLYIENGIIILGCVYLWQYHLKQKWHFYREWLRYGDDGLKTNFQWFMCHGIECSFGDDKVHQCVITKSCTKFHITWVNHCNEAFNPFLHVNLLFGTK